MPHGGYKHITTFDYLWEYNANDEPQAEQKAQHESQPIASHEN